MITRIGNTTYYSTYSEWKAAGRPGGDGVYDYVIGDPPKAGEPASGARLPDGRIVPWNEFDPTKSTGYKPPAPATNTPKPPITSTTAPASTVTKPPPNATAPVTNFDELKFKAEDINKRVDVYNSEIKAYKDNLTAFESRWSGYIKDNVFTGSESDFVRYQKEFNSIDKQLNSLNMTEQEIKARSRNFETARTKELEKYVPVGKDAYILKVDYDQLEPGYQKILKEQGFEVLNTRISADNRAAIVGVLRESFNRFKKEDGSIDLVNAIKSGLGEKTIAIAYGEDRAKEAIKSAGLPPPGGWGPKAPTLPQALGVVTAETLFPPSKQWVEPELHYKATGMDWAVGTAQVALLALPLVGWAGKAGLTAATAGRGALAGTELAAKAATGARIATAARITSALVQTGATAVFTKDTVDHWSEMTPLQRAFSLGMDALVAGGAFRAIAPKQAARIQSRMVSIASNQKGGAMLKAAADERGFGTTGKMTAEQYQAQYQKMVDARTKAKPWELTPEERKMTPEQRNQVAEQIRGLSPEDAIKRRLELSKTMGGKLAANEAQALMKKFDKIRESIGNKDPESLRKAGRDLMKWTKENPDSPVAEVIDRRARDFVNHADHYAKLGDAADNARVRAELAKQSHGEMSPSEELTRGAQGGSGIPKSEAAAWEREVERRMERAIQDKADAFYREHKIPSTVENLRKGETPQDRATRIREYLEDRFGRDYVEKRLDLTEAERRAIAKEVMDNTFADAIETNAETLDDIDDFLKGEKKGGNEPRPGGDIEAPPERGGGGGTKTAVKEKIETKTKVEQEAERILKEKAKTDTTPREKTRAKPEEEVKPNEDTAAKPGEETRANPKTEAKPDVKPEEKTKPGEKTGIKESVKPTEKMRPAIQPQPKTEPKVEPGTQPAATPGTKAKEVTRTKPLESTKPGVNIRPREKSLVKPSEQTQFREADQLKPIGQTTIKPIEDVKPVPGVNPIEIPGPATLHPPPPIKIKTRIKVVPGSSRPEKQEEWTPEEIANSTAIKAGMGWWLRRPDGRVKFFKELPPGVKDVRGGKGSGYASVQTVQGKPIDFDLKIGFQRVKIRKPSREPGKTGSVAYIPDVMTGKRPIKRVRGGLRRSRAK